MRFGQSNEIPDIRRRALRVLAAVGGLLLSTSFAAAQYIHCAAIQAEIASLGRTTSVQSDSYQRAAQKQQGELAKTIAYANSLGCNRQRFLFFGDPPPPQCGALNSRISAMQGNLGQLQAAVQNGGNEQKRRSLSAQYDAYCRNQPTSRAPGNFLEQLFSGNSRMQELPLDPPRETLRDNDYEQEPEERGPRRGSMAVCVRKCDGGFFPVSYAANRGNLDSLAELCTALCPNTEAMLFTKRPDAEIDEALSYEGESYESLSNAGKFKKKFDPACTCKPANKSWSEALAAAEKIIASKNSRDLIVTPQKAEELSRPKLTAAALAAQRPVRGKPAAPAKTQPPAESDEDRAVAALDRAGKADAEAANGSNAGITPGVTTAGQRFGVSDGQRETITTPDGTKRRVRVVGPKT